MAGLITPSSFCSLLWRLTQRVTYIGNMQASGGKFANQLSLFIEARNAEILTTPSKQKTLGLVTKKKILIVNFLEIND